MKLRNIVNELINRGHSVLFKERKEGGIEIIQIDGQKYNKRKGNEVARNMLGQQLSPLQKSHLTTIRTPKGVAVKSLRTPKLPLAVGKELRKLQRIQRKTGVKERTLTKNLLGYLKVHTEEEAITMLKETTKTFKKEVWTGLYGRMAARINSDNMVWNNQAMQELASYLMEAEGNDYIINNELYNEFMAEFYDIESSKSQSQISSFAQSYLEKLKNNARKNRKEEE